MSTLHMITSPNHRAPFFVTSVSPVTSPASGQHEINETDALVLIGDGVWADTNALPPSLTLYVHAQDALDRGITTLPEHAQRIDDATWVALISDHTHVLTWGGA